MIRKWKLMTHTTRKTIYEDDALTVEQIGDKTIVSIFNDNHYKGSYELIFNKESEVTEVKPLD